MSDLRKLIIMKFALAGYNIQPSVVDVIIKSVPPDKLDYAISQICKYSNEFIITDDVARKVLSRIRFDGDRNERREKVKRVVQVREGVRVRDVTGKSSCEGTIEDFIAYFNSRFEKLSRIIRGRMKPVEISKISSLNGERVEIVGIVNGVREYQNYALIELEDKTGRVNVIATDRLKETALELLGDEVIGVMGTVKGKSVVADRIIFPDIPFRDRKRERVGIVFISDTHFGSKEFLEREWNLFVKWLNYEIGDKKVIELAERIKYVVIAGDIVDGVGVYPEQEKDLKITDIYEQYEFAAEQIDKIREEVKVIVSVGNHDAIRQAEPQPALPKEYRDLFSKNVICVGNPAYLDLDGVNVLVYHGRSLDDVITKISRLSYERPHEAMIELLKRRHMSPMYGERSPIAPEREDWLVIDEVPDIFHCGHVHTYGVGFYRGVIVINSSTWQSQTEFQRKVNLNPDPGKVAVYYNGEMGTLRFYDGK